MNSAQKAEKFTAIIGLVAGGSGIAIVPESLRHMHVPSVVFRPLADIERVSELAVAYRRDERSPAVNLFLAKLKEGALFNKQKKRSGTAKLGAELSNGAAESVRDLESQLNGF